METTKLAIIDGDGLIYHSLRETLQESLLVFEEKLQNIFNQTKVTHYVIFYSNGKYFRHAIDLEYKGNRKGKPIPKYLKAIKAWAIDEYNLQSMDNVEADDLCAYWMNKNEYEVSGNIELWGTFEKVLCTPDKDLLQSIPGKHFNYSYKLTEEAKVAKKADENYEVKDEDVIKGWWEETTIDEAKMFKLSQLITGDIADNVKGVEGKGIKYWEKMIDSGRNIIHEILIEYILKYGISQGIYNFQKNYRTLHLLETEEDYIREVGEIPKFPEITKIISEELKEEDF